LPAIQLGQQLFQSSFANFVFWPRAILLLLLPASPGYFLI